MKAIKSNEKVVKEGECIIVNKNTKPFEVGTGLTFKENGTYIINVTDNCITVTKG